MTQNLKEMSARWGDWYGASGEEIIEFIREHQQKAREAIPDQDVKFVVWSGWNDKMHIELRWDRPLTQEETLLTEHRSLRQKILELAKDRATVLKYHDEFPKQQEFDQLIAEAESIEAQLSLMGSPLRESIRSEIN